MVPSLPRVSLAKWSDPHGCRLTCHFESIHILIGVGRRDRTVAIDKMDALEQQGGSDHTVPKVDVAHRRITYRLGCVEC